MYLVTAKIRATFYPCPWIFYFLFFIFFVFLGVLKKSKEAILERLDVAKLSEV